MFSRASGRARVKHAALFSLVLWACAEGTTKGTVPPGGTGGAGAGGLAGAGSGGAGAGSAGDASFVGGTGGEASGGNAGIAGHSAAGSGGTSGTAGQAGSHDHPPPARGGSAGTGGAAGEAGEAGGGGEAGAYTPPPCTIVAPTACPDPAPSYADVEPTFRERCVVCHMGAADGPWPLTNYGHVASWGPEIRAMLLTCSMPPPEERMPLPNDENLAILTWIRCGMPP